MAPKNILAKMHRELICNFFILCCLVACEAAKCLPELCGSMNVTYPFWIRNPSCGYPGFQINCTANVSSNEYAPLLPTPVGDFEILNISDSGYTIIDSTSLKAMSCNGTDDAFKVFRLTTEGPFTISSFNRFVVIGCRAMGSFTTSFNSSGGGRCESACLKQDDPKYCNTHGCCEAGIPGNGKFVNFTGGGISYKEFPGVCGFSTILEPDTYRLQDNETGFFARGRYGLRLDWGIGHENCSAARGTSNYACAEQAKCTDSPTGEGHVCTCLDGYEGNGYSNGTDCTDVNECNLGNDCVEQTKGGECINLPGSYNCSCQKGYVGDGFRNREGCASTSSKSALPAIIGGVGAVVGVLLIVVVLLLIAILKRTSSSASEVEKFLRDFTHEMPTRYSYSQLKKITNNFTDKLGEGGFGVVYKGKLGNGNMVAVKILDQSRQSEGQFMNEVATIGRIHHVHLVRLVGYCFGRSRSALVYEYMVNGSLEKFVFVKKEEQLSWEQLYSIALGAARGIAYLHEECERRIIHFDIKPHNILLDADFTPKVSDFGLAKLCGRLDDHISMTAARGTPGYVAPELWSTNLGPITDKADVYSFGMLLLEIAGGRKNIDVQVSSCEVYFPDWAFKHLEKGELEERLRGRVREENAAQVVRMCKVGLWCIQYHSANRPTMSRVVHMLEGNVDEVSNPPFPFNSSASPQPHLMYSSQEFSSM